MVLKLRNFYRSTGKRILDLLLVVPALILLLPVMVVIAILVWHQIGTPILFKQERPGFSNRPFILYKFRTMTNERDANGELLPDTDRLVPLGRFLRATSLDEVPELINVIRGEMSLVGPRPLLMRYMPYFTERELHRHDVRPGITGWAQINGRNYLHWDERLELDVWYVEHCSPLLDVRIILQTVAKVARGEDVAVDAAEAMIDLDVDRRAKQEDKNLS